MAGYLQRDDPLSQEQEEKLKAISARPPPPDMIAVRAFVLKEFGIVYSRQGAFQLMHRLGFVFA